MRSEGDIIRAALSAEEYSYDASCSIKCPFENLPADYIRYSKDDLRSEASAGILNAIHNSKRAIECRINWLLHLYGIKYSRKNLKSKMDALNEISAGPPRILADIIRKRNLLEHEFKSAERREAEDVLDIAELFVYATKSFCENTALSWYCYPKSGSAEYVELSIVLDRNRSTILGFVLSSEVSHSEISGEDRIKWAPIYVEATSSGNLKKLNAFYDRIGYRGAREFLVTIDGCPSEYRELVAKHIHLMKNEY